MGNKMDRYCLPSKIANQVLNDIHLYHMHLGVDGIVRQAQKCVWMPGLHAAVCRELLKYLRLADHFSAFVMVIPIKSKSHEEVMEAFINNWTYRIGPPEVLVSDNKIVSKEVQRMCRAYNF